MMCGPFIAAIMKGMVRNGPTPTMLMMLVEVACSRPMRRSRVVIAWIMVLNSRGWNRSADYADCADSYRSRGTVVTRVTQVNQFSLAELRLERIAGTGLWPVLPGKSAGTG